MSDTTVATTKPPHPVVALRNYFDERIDSIRSALPPHIKAERFLAVIMTAAQLNPDLIACERRSLFNACMRAAQDGLMPDGTEAAIVPYKTKAQYIPMYQGFLKKFRNSGQFKWIGVNIVYEGEQYAHWIDQEGEHFNHVPGEEGDKPRVIKLVYAAATTKDGGFFVEPLTMNQINKRRNMSRASRDDAPWKQWPDEMMKKTAIRVLSKLLPKSSDIDSFIRRDEEESLGIDTSDANTNERTAAYGSALDYFAGESDGLPANAAVGGEGSSQGTAAGAASEASASEPVSATAESLVIRAAYEAGKNWRASGGRRNTPGELRAPERRNEANAWQDGFDGKPLPMFDT